MVTPFRKFPSSSTGATGRALSLLVVLMLTLPSLAVLASDGGGGGASGEDRAAEDPNEWLTFKGDDQRSGVSASEAPSVGKVLWENQYVGSVIYSSPTVWNGTVFIGVSGMIKAIWAKNGTERWTYIAPNPVHTSPVIADGVIYAGVNDFGGTSAVAVDALTGEEVWNASIPDFCTAAPLVLGNSVYFGCQDGKLYCLRTSDGQERWNFSAGRAILYGSVAEWNGVIYFGIEADNDDNGKLFAVDASSGTEEWNRSIHGSVWSSPAVAGGMVLVSTAGDKTIGIDSRKGYVYAFNITTGAQSWRTQDLGMVMASPTIYNGRVYVGTFGKFINDIQFIAPQMYCLDLADGDRIWNRTVTHGSDNAKVWTSVTVAGAKVIFGDELGYLNVWNINGLKIWDHPITMGAAVKTTPAVAGEMIFAANTLGYVTGFGSQPDLSVNATSIDVADEYPHLGQRVNVRARISNIGDKTATGRVFMYNGSLDDWHTVINSTVVTIAPGRSTWVYAVWTANMVGTRAFWVRVTDVVPNEGDESNNEAKRVIEVLPPSEGWLMARADNAGTGFNTSEPPSNNITNWLRAMGSSPGPGVVTTTDSVLVPAGTELVALDRNDGSVRWSREMSSSASTAPAVGDGSVFVGTTDGHLWAVDLEDGTVRFKVALNGTVTAGPNVAGMMLLVGTTVGTDGGLLYALDTFDGRELWSRDMSAPVNAHPAAWGNTVFALSDDGALLSINSSSGALRWQYPVGAAPGSSLTSAPAVSGDLLFVASTSGFVYCLDADPSDGVDEGKADPPGSVYDVVWTYKEQDLEPFEGSPSVVDGLLVLPVGTDGVLALNAADGSVAWTASVPDSAPLTLDLIAVNGSVVVGGVGVRILDAGTGAVTWRYDATSSPMVGGPAAVDDMLFVTDSRGIVFAFGKVKNQPPVARIDSPSPDSQFRINESITFDASSSTDDKDLPDTSFRWDFGDGNTSLARITTHRYAEDGQYTVTLTVTDVDGDSDNSSLTLHVLANHAPILDWWDVDPDQGDAQSVFFNFSVRYTDPDNDPPSIIQLRVSPDPEFQDYNMLEVDPGDVDYIDGKMYYYRLTLGSRPYPEVAFTASDGIAERDLVVNGPTVLQHRTFPNTVGDIEVDATYVGPNVLQYIPVTSPPSTYPPGLYPIGVYVELFLNTTFLQAAALTFNYTFHNIEEMNLSTLAVYRWSVSGSEAGWEYLEDSTVDPSAGSVNSPIPSLQNDIYTVLGNKENPPPNNNPVAVISVDGEAYSPGATVKKIYRPGEVIRFDGARSYDPDASTLNDYVAYWGWNFADGESSEGKQASHAYEVPDKYTVTLTVKDSFGRTGNVDIVVVVRAEGESTLLYALVLIGIVVILILLFFPKGGSKPAANGPKPEARERPAPEPEVAMESENGKPPAPEEPETGELDSIIDELEVDRGK